MYLGADLFHDLGTGKCTRNPEDVEALMDDEIDGYVEYLMQAEAHPKPQVKRTFESMAVDEFNHFRILQQLKEHGHLNPRHHKKKRR